FKTYAGDSLIDQSNFQLGYNVNLELDIRIFIYDQYVSGYCNDRCVYDYAFSSAVYPSAILASLSVTNGMLVLSNISRKELDDQREAVFVDYEANTESAIQSIIQQRPIEMNAGVNRELEFTYSSTKDSVTAHHVKRYENVLEDNLQLSSDGIVYYEDVGIAINEDTAEQVGLITRMYRLSELSSGAISAAEKYQRTALQKRNAVSLDMRLDPRLEVRDILDINLIAAGTQRNIVDNIIVEEIQIRLEDGNYRTSLSGRKNQ
ncbi:MAG: hypothetical protein COW52_04090, partial [Nitrospirae bacterium CG17_big_fil_post_rev_8_21_14_2_50_50_9]